MTIVPVELPPGMFRNGTAYDAINRFYEGNLVRWHEGVLRPIGGWVRELQSDGVTPVPALISDPDVEAIRDAHSWTDNNSNRHFIYGSNSALYHVSKLGVVTDITPAGFTGSDKDPSLNRGYGLNLYGTGIYGARRPIAPLAIPSIYRWKFDNWGEDVVCGPSDPQFRGLLYLYDTSAGGVATAISNAPTDTNGFVVTDERIVMSIGANSESRIVRWSDREDLTEWTPSRTNYAGDYFIQGTGSLLSIIKVLNQVLILSETDAHVARFIGAPLVYGFDRVGNDCGPWSGNVVAVTDRMAIWPSRRDFWMFDGTLKKVPCDIMSYLIEDINTSMLSKAFVMRLANFSEIVWYYVSAGATEVDSYLAYDYDEHHWHYGRLSRTCGLSSETAMSPRMVTSDGLIYVHEQQDVLVNGAWAATGPLQLGAGEHNMAVRSIYPDSRTHGDIQFTLYGSQMPTDPEYTYGPYAYDNPIRTRAMGRQIRMRVDGVTVGWMSGAHHRFDVASAGLGRR